MYIDTQFDNTRLSEGGTITGIRRCMYVCMYVDGWVGERLSMRVGRYIVRS